MLGSNETNAIITVKNFKQRQHPFWQIGASCFFFVLSINKYINFLEDNQMNIPTKFDSNWPSGFREDDWNTKVYERSGRRRKPSDDDITSPFGTGDLKNYFCFSLNTVVRKPWHMRWASGCEPTSALLILWPKVNNR